MNPQPVAFSVNGQACTVHAHPLKRLLDVLREDLGLTGTKEGCGEGECGACSVLFNGELANSCLLPIAQVAGADVVTIEGAGQIGLARRIQASFADCGGAQCGICTPGMVMAAVYLLSRVDHPSRADVREALSGNLCRCTGYQKIVDAVHAASLRPDENLPPGI